MHKIITGGLLAAAFAATPAAAQTADWSGFHVGARAGISNARNGNERIEFDNNLDGSFGDTVNTAAGANAFSPGFCNGAALGATPAQGCRKDKEKGDYALMAGYDQQFGNVVVGVVGEIGRSSARDSVTAYSTTPAFYTMTRRIKNSAAIRARVGLALGDTLPYVTAGVASAKIRHDFATSNAVNTFTERGDDDRSTGFRYGAGVEQRFGNIAVGLLYLGTRYSDNDYRVRASGPAPATNPFILSNAGGTDFRRSDDRFMIHSLSLTAGLRF
ncbi:outer membrane beta-barrel protein [Sphingomonas swuensis]|uniref:Outer membrane beta-barrel protein n=1 Tax=Sphingomonas swuensis TaxID=977800 RepID=A0ABP7SYL6_9SPHN